MHAHCLGEQARASSDIAPCRDFAIVGKLQKAQSRWNMGEIGKLMRKIERKVRKAAEVAALGHSLDKNQFSRTSSPSFIFEINFEGRETGRSRKKKGRGRRCRSRKCLFFFFSAA